ncbi:hypothetical protein RF11_06368 [Thelohanellus kitauei]|uniref:Helix-turn-helix domain-containing protein n=1 Tax=Thelohanellus kitauei TaxID=669202 RepID=A0A0C2MRD8_THEKT|nr:hypothetical protein RF11_06368 [Thelohanellus kitauei]
MGAPYSPALANIYLLEYDSEVISDKGVIFYRRYIDDVLIILQKGSEVPLSELNVLKLKFGDFQRGNVVTFLDLVLWNHFETIEYATYFKKLHSFNYIHSASWHSWAMKKGMIHSQFLRIIKTNSNSETRDFFIEFLIRKFILCGYSSKLLKQLLNKTLSILNTVGYMESKKLLNKDIHYKHIAYHPSYDRINSKLKDIYNQEEIRCKYNFSYYNQKCVRQILKELHPAYRERVKGITHNESTSPSVDPNHNSEIGTLQFYGTKHKDNSDLESRNTVMKNDRKITSTTVVNKQDVLPKNFPEANILDYFGQTDRCLKIDPNIIDITTLPVLKARTPFQFQIPIPSVDRHQSIINKSKEMSQIVHSYMKYRMNNIEKLPLMSRKTLIELLKNPINYEIIKEKLRKMKYINNSDDTSKLI